MVTHLFCVFWPLTFAQSHTRTAAVFVDEFDTRGFESAPDYISGRTMRLAGGYVGPRLHLVCLPR